MRLLKARADKGTGFFYGENYDKNCIVRRDWMGHLSG